MRPSVILKSLVISAWVHDFAFCALKFHCHFYFFSTRSSCTSLMTTFSSVIVALGYHMPTLFTLRFPASFFFFFLIFLSRLLFQDFWLKGRAESMVQVLLPGSLSEGDVTQCQVCPTTGARSAGTPVSSVNLGVRSRCKMLLSYLKKEQRV